MSQTPALISTLPAHRPIAVWRQTRCDAAEHPAGEVVHDHSALAVYLGGTTRMWMRRDYRLVRGDMLLIPEGPPHCAKDASGGERLGVMLCTGCMRGAWGEYLRAAFYEVRRGEVASHVGRSPAYLATLMKQHTGRTVVEWITHSRMALARQLLLSSDDGVEAIAEHVGYASASHFHRTFRRLHKVTPGDWRHAHRSNPFELPKSS